jgi:hypothetical protein
VRGAVKSVGVRDRGDSGLAGHGSKEIFYFRRPHYVRWPNEAKPSKVQVLAAQLLSVILWPNFQRS